MVARGAHAGEVVLLGRDITLERQIARLEHHLEECDVPTDFELIADPHVIGGDRPETRIDVLVSAFEKAHQTPGRGARRDPVLRTDLDLRKIRCLSWRRNSSQWKGCSEGERQRRPNAANHGYTLEHAAPPKKAPNKTN